MFSLSRERYSKATHQLRQMMTGLTPWSAHMTAILLVLMALMWGINAYAQTATATTTVAIAPVGGDVPCDIGPALPSIPTETQAAGLTHCVANFDFSTSTYAKPAFDPTNGWYDCAGEQPNVMWHHGSAGIYYYNPCLLRQKVDPVTGQTIMNVEWLPIYDNRWGGYFRVGQANQIGGWTHNNWVNTDSLTVPNFYIETANRVEATCPSCPSSSGGPDDVYIWGFAGSPDGGGWEIDIQEFVTNPGPSGRPAASGGFSGIAAGGFAWTDWGGGNGSRLPSGFNALNYHKYSALWTSDGKTNQIACLYIDDILQGDSGCWVNAPSGTVDTKHFNNRNWILFSAGSNGGNATLPIDFDIQYIRVWSCAAYATTQCNGTTLYGPDANGLRYWH